MCTLSTSRRSSCSKTSPPALSSAQAHRHVVFNRAHTPDRDARRRRSTPGRHIPPRSRARRHSRIACIRPTQRRFQWRTHGGAPSIDTRPTNASPPLERAPARAHHRRLSTRYVIYLACRTLTPSPASPAVTHPPPSPCATAPLPPYPIEGRVRRAETNANAVRTSRHAEEVHALTFSVGLAFSAGS